MQRLTIIQRRCLLVTHDFKPGVSEIFRECSEYLTDQGFYTVFIHVGDLDSYHCDQDYDFALTCGGDGLAIFVGRVLAVYNIPVFVMNFGVVGFLATFSAISWRDEIEELLAGSLRIQEHLLLDSCLVNATFPARNISNLALNEVLIKGCEYSGICEFEIFIGSDNSLGSVRSDGLMIVTPTGSTAYALSCGGPILFGEVSAFLVMAVNPHSLSYRPLLIPSDQQITLKLSKSNRYKISFVCDGKLLGDFVQEDILNVKFSKKKARFLVASDYSFFATLRNKLGWGAEVVSRNSWS